jgi:hypothetical protein
MTTIALVDTRLEILGESIGMVVSTHDTIAAVIKRKFGAHHEVSQAVESLEKKPDSVGRREMPKEEINGSGAAEDAEILAAARSMLEILKKQPGAQEIVQQTVTGNHIFSGTSDIHIGDTTVGRSYRWRHDGKPRD